MQRVTINNGMVMRAWYDILSLGTDVDRREDEAGLRASMVEVEALIERERSRGIDASRIVLMGFSQGCAMTLMTGLRHADRLAGLVGLSGYLPLASRLVDERSPANAGHAGFPGPRPLRSGDSDRPCDGQSRRTRRQRPAGGVA